MISRLTQQSGREVGETSGQEQNRKREHHRSQQVVNWAESGYEIKEKENGKMKRWRGSWVKEGYISSNTVIVPVLGPIF